MWDRIWSIWSILKEETERTGPCRADRHDGRIQKLTVRVSSGPAKQWRFLWIFWWIMKLGSCRFIAHVDAIRPSDSFLKSWNDAYTLNNAWNWSILQFQMSDEFFKNRFNCLAGYAPSIFGFSHHGPPVANFRRKTAHDEWIEKSSMRV